MGGFWHTKGRDRTRDESGRPRGRKGLDIVRVKESITVWRGSFFDTVKASCVG